ncbi:MAG TPA: nucleoside triphosphate pyrophosphatase [Stellaceae bacterium]|jgi:septum formation protein|nr:nucleoside triphosphate pyrophosphatase [Stellaceae bacterium]
MTLVARQTLILASASLARAKILAAAGLTVTVDPVNVDESAVKDAFHAERRDASSCAIALAETKARRASLRHPGALVIGADQMLVCGGEWYDKPKDLAVARAQLQALRGKRHELPTAVAVLRDGAVLWHAVETPALTMRNVSDGFIDRYLTAMGEAALASVGAYALEGLGVNLMAKIEGDHFCILGLPLLPLLDFLRGAGAVES